MKIRIRKSGKLPPPSLKSGDRLRHQVKLHSSKLHDSLSRLSHKNRRQQLKADKQAEILARNKLNHPELFKNPKTKITLNAVGDRRGMEYKGDSEHMRKIRAMRRIYNKQMPVLACNGCSFQNVCPQFKSGFECAYLPFLNSHKVENESDLMEYMKELLGAGMRRTHQALLMETLSGAAPSLENTEAMTMLFNQFKDFHELVTNKDSISIETEDGSIISRLFGGIEKLVDKTKKAHATPIDVDPVRVIEQEASPALSELESLGGEVDTRLVKERAREELEPVMSYLKG